MREEHKDRVEDVGGAVLEGALAMMPIIGGPMAVAVNRALGSRRTDRLERIIVGIRRELDEAIADGRIADPLAALDSDAGLAAVERVLRASQEAFSEEKLHQLRMALVGGTILGWGDETQELLALAEELEPIHVSVLSGMERSGIVSFVEDAQETIRRALVADPDRFPRVWDDLVRRGLIDEQRMTQGAYGGDIFEAKSYRISIHGLSFLTFLSGRTGP